MRHPAWRAHGQSVVSAVGGLGFAIGPFAQEVLINAGMWLEPVDFLLGEFIGGFQGVDFLFQFFKQFGRRRETGQFGAVTELAKFCLPGISSGPHGHF